jgi:hypothetical protein
MREVCADADNHSIYILRGQTQAMPATGWAVGTDCAYSARSIDGREGERWNASVHSTFAYACRRLEKRLN